MPRLHQVVKDPSVRSSVDKHFVKWQDCELCPLCLTRSNVVLWRGRLPCDILIVGEGPGVSENSLGFPFIGEAGKLLDQIVAQALEDVDCSVAFTNIVACVPMDKTDMGSGTPRMPKASEADRCSARLTEFIRIANPKMIITAGQVSKKFLPDVGLPVRHMIHPAAILRMVGQKQSMETKRCTLLLRTIGEQYGKA